MADLDLHGGSPSSSKSSSRSVELAVAEMKIERARVGANLRIGSAEKLVKRPSRKCGYSGVELRIVNSIHYSSSAPESWPTELA